VVLALLAAWQVPPYLDWTRYRAAIASVASARMGRPVMLGGQVRLLLLPDAMLVADGVTLADRGDGVSARIGSLRLRVALGPLLRGRLVARRLELDDPSVVLPWPLPRGAGGAVPGRVAGGFSARVEGGSLRISGLELSGVTCGVQTDPDTGAFSAQGVARLAGLPWRFTALLGAPGPDGVSLLTVTLDGQDAALGTGGTLRGRVLAGGTVKGVLTLRGDNLSRLLPAPAEAWRLQGAVEADESEVRAPKLDVGLGASPGEGSATLRMGTAPSLTAMFRVGQVTLDGWNAAAALRPGVLPVHLDVSATGAVLLGGQVRDVRAVMDLGRAAGAVRATATLPGGAAARLEAHRDAPADAPGHAGGDAVGAPAALVGHAALTVADGGTFLAWLRPAAPFLLAHVPDDILGETDLAADVRLGGGTASFTGVIGHVGGVAVSGQVAVTQDPRPAVSAVFKVDRLVLPSSAEAGQPWFASPRALAASFSRFDATVDVQAGAFRVGALDGRNFVVQAQAGAGGVALRRLAGDADGLHLEASGGIGVDGGVVDGRMDLTAVDAAQVALPLAWPTVPAPLWQGPLHLGIAASGPPQAIVGQVRGDLGDLRAEAELRADTVSPALLATATIRHPGAPRLLAELGGGGRADWLGQGSVALLTHLVATPGHLTLQDFSVAAGALRVEGQGEADFSGAEPAVSGRVRAQNLVVPAFPGRAALLPLWVLNGWHGGVQVSADAVQGPLLPPISNVAASLTVGGGAAAADDVVADVAGGHVAGGVAVDAGAPAAVWALRGAVVGAAVDQMPAPDGITLHGGTMDVAADVTAQGGSPAALLATLQGDVHGGLHGASLVGVDLPRLDKLLAQRGPRLKAALNAALNTALNPEQTGAETGAQTGAQTGALAGGETGPVSGGFDGTLADGVLTVGGAALTGAAGVVRLDGNWSLSGDAADVLLTAWPGVAQPPALRLRVTAGKRSVDTSQGVAWANGAMRAMQGRATQGRARARSSGR
jgi:hypothetical protein